MASAVQPALHEVRHFKVEELAELWAVSDDTIRRLFRDEPGVINLGNEESSRKKRRYVSLRIPETVAERVHRKLSKV